jgi:hypothetical protein
MKKLELSIPSVGISRTITLHTDEAPRTCETVWNMLDEPLTGKTNHAVFSGYEFFLYCPPVPLDLENHVVFPKAGQVIYYHLPAGRNADNVAHKLNLGGHREDAAEIAIWYGEGDLRRMTEVGSRGNLFGTIDGDLDEFLRSAYRLLNEGQAEATLRRLDA